MRWPITSLCNLSSTEPEDRKEGRGGEGRGGEGREGKGRGGEERGEKKREGKGREGTKREGKGREEKGREGEGREGTKREGKRNKKGNKKGKGRERGSLLTGSSSSFGDALGGVGCQEPPHHLGAVHLVRVCRRLPEVLLEAAAEHQGRPRLQLAPEQRRVPVAGIGAHEGPFWRRERDGDSSRDARELLRGQEVRRLEGCLPGAPPQLVCTVQQQGV